MASLNDLILKEHGYLTDYEINYEDFKDIYNFLDSADIKER